MVAMATRRINAEIILCMHWFDAVVELNEKKIHFHSDAVLQNLHTRENRIFRRITICSEGALRKTVDKSNNSIFWQLA